jgi:hypothetical protein
MRKHDWIFVIALGAAIAPFALLPEVRALYGKLNQEHGVLLSFVKFAVLATLGEVIALRIRKGRYHEPGFGLLPRALVWGLLGVAIKASFVIFAAGTPAFLQSLGLAINAAVMNGPFSTTKALGAFSISLALNLVFAPVMMTTHKITDAHIARTGGSLRGLLQPIAMADILTALRWDVHWHFVLKKTIPLFWIPAHTVTFLLPAEHQVLFAAVLSVALGVLLALASLKGRSGRAQEQSPPGGSRAA